MSIISGVITGGGFFQVFMQKDNNEGYYADAAARDVYFGANPLELDRLDQDEFLIIRLADDGSGSVAYQQRATSSWVDVTSLVQGNTGPAGATGNSFFFESLAARDTFFGTSPNEGLLKNKLPISVNVGDETASTFVWGGPSTPVSYDSDLWRLAAAEVSAGTLYLGVGGAGVSSGAEVLNFTQADGGLTYLHGVPYDDTGSEEPAYWKLPALVTYPLADVSSSTLSDPQGFGTTNTIDSYVKSSILIPATSGELRVQIWIGTDETGPQIVDTFFTVAPGDIGNQTAFAAPNPTFIKTGMATYTKFSGVQLKGGLQTSGPFIGQTVPFISLELFLAEKVPFVYNEMSGFSLKVPNASGVAAIEFLNDSDVTGLSISYSDGSDDTEIIGEIGNLIIGTDESDSYINISPDGGTGFKKVPTAGYVFDIYAAGSDIVGLHSGKAVTLEVGTYGDSDSTNLIFNKGDVGANQSEFVLFNNNHATEATRHFRMGYADEIATQGGLNISDANNFVSIGTRTDPDSPLHIYQDDTETGDQCGLTIEQDGTGDSVIQWLLSGGQRWVAGIANSGGDAFEIASSINLGSNTRFIINTTGEVKITDSLMVGSSSDPTSPLHVYQNDTETGVAAGVTIEQDGTGDSVIHHTLTGIQTISAGVDYSGSGHYKISGSADLSTGNILTATIAGNVGIGDDNPASKLHLYEDNTLTGSTVGLTIEQDGTGDSLAQWYLSGGARYLAGIDNSDSDLFKIEYGAFLSDGAGIQIDSNNHVGIKTAPDSILHVYQDDAVTGTSGGITIEQDGGGDAMLQFLLTGGTRWVMGIDNDDSDRFKINLGTSLESTQSNFVLDETNGIDLHISNSSTTNWELAAGIEMHNHNTADDTYTSLVHRGATNIAAGILFKNDDYSADYAHMVFGATDANGFEENALTVKPAHIEISNSTNTPYGGSGIIENLLTYSEQIDNAIWQKLGSNAPVVVANDAVAPNGETTADKVTVSGGAGYLRHNVTLVEDDIYTLSFWAKNVSGDKTIQIALELADYTSIETTSMWKRYSIPLIANSENFVAFRTVGSAYHLWGVQLHAGTEETPYSKTEETALTTATYGASVNGDIVVSGDLVRPGGQTFATKPSQVVEVWSLDDMPRVGGTGDVIPEYKLYRFMQEIDWGTTRLKLENDAYALFEGADVFVTSQTYSGTDPWVYGEGTIRCVGNGMTWKITADNATMFDITSGGWGMDYSTLMTTGDNCSLGTIVAPSVTNPLLGARFISTRSLFQGFKTGLKLVNPGNIHIDVSFFHDSTDAIGPMLSVIGLGKAGVIESTEVTMASATSSFLYISPITKAPVTCLGITLADEQTFFEPGDTGDITLFADASISAESVTSVSDNSGTARFNFSAPPTLFVGQKVTMSSFTNYDNGTFTITATGAGYYETGVAYNIADTGGSFTSDSVTVTSATHGLSELDAVLICCTMEYNHGSTIYNVQTNTFQVNTPWHTAETTGEWNDGSLDHTSKYVTSFNNGAQQNSNPAPSFNVADNATTTSTTTSWGNVIFGTTGSAIEVGNSNQNFVLLDDVTGLIRYEGLDPLTIKLTPSISMFKSGGDVEHQFRLFKTTGTPAFDPHTIKRGISGDTGAVSLNCSAVLNPDDEFRLQVKATSSGSTITISDFSL